jgi:hypothetical protein
MAEDTRQPDTDASNSAEVSDKPAVAEDQPSGTLTADTEKSSKVEDAKTRVVAARDALTEKAAALAPGGPPAAPKAPVKKKEQGPKPVDASGHPLVQKLKARVLCKFVIS